MEHNNFLTTIGYYVDKWKGVLSRTQQVQE